MVFSWHNIILWRIRPRDTEEVSQAVLVISVFLLVTTSVEQRTDCCLTDQFGGWALVKMLVVHIKNVSNLLPGKGLQSMV